MDQIGKYKVIEEIGQGGMGTVYKARDPVIGREVAIKVISERTMRSPNLRARFLREIASAGRLSHENIMTIYDAGDHDGRPYFVMELLGGRDLSKVIHEGTFSLDEKLSIAIQVARGLCYAHKRGVIHRDIKPDNIRVLDGGRAKIMDFGIARIESETHTPTHTSIGTPRYMSPEQIKGEPVDQRTDVFSYGALVYELLGGRPPFNGERITTVIYKILHEDPEPLDLGSGRSMDALRRVVERCLEKNLGARYPNFDAVIEDLAAVLAERNSSGPTVTVPRPAADLPDTGARRDEVQRDDTLLNTEGESTVAEKKPRDEAAGAPPAGTLKKRIGRSPVLMGVVVVVGLLGLTFALTRSNGEPEPPARETVVREELDAGGLLGLEGATALVPDDAAADDPTGDPAGEESAPAEPESATEDLVEASSARAEAQRTRMRSAKSRAEQSGAAADASSLYDRALAQERAGDVALRRGTADGYTAAQTAYTEAARLYDQARREAGQRQEAEAARAAMTQAHATVVDRRTDPRIAADFQRAETRRTTGERQLRDGEFQQAAASFGEARTLYAAAAQTASQPVAEPVSEPVAEPTQPVAEPAREPTPPEPSPEARAQAAAEGAAGSIAARLKQALEQESAAAMRAVHSTYDGWDGFFRIAEDVQATVSVQSVEVSGRTATADVSVRLRFRNTTKNADESTNVRYGWTLEQRGDAWALTSVATR